MQISDQGLLLVKQAEGFRRKVYPDPAGYYTIGYGHKLTADESFPDGVTEPEAALMLHGDMREAEAAVERLVTAPLAQGQFDALCDFTYNLGAGRLGSSTLLRLLNEGQYEGAANELLRWNHINGVVSDGLTRRREAEYKLWHA